MEALRTLGLWSVRSDEKFIPDIFLSASPRARLDLLAGLMDTDGWAERWGSARFCSTSERLARGVADLVRSPGGWGPVRRGNPTPSPYHRLKKACPPAHACNLQH